MIVEINVAGHVGNNDLETIQRVVNVLTTGTCQACPQRNAVVLTLSRTSDGQGGSGNNSGHRGGGKSKYGRGRGFNHSELKHQYGRKNPY